ncbi:MFS transporter [Burkholderia pyrrocinia]|uniref:MFS transporter n=1 Tax=Burkholderia pyrrocinia TaxID=60550 RepID=UPI002AB2582E|nr:MFS transporter [Burkholderia pyrrocinia]
MVAVNTRDNTARPTRHAARSALVAALLGLFVVTLDAVVVNVALATMGHEFRAGISGLQWVVDGYTLTFAALLLSAGALADRIGARQAFALGLVIFMMASAACGFAPSLSVLIVARFAQGVGAAVMMPSSMSLIRQSYTDPVQRGHAVALWAMGGAVAATSGPVIGGLLALLNWRWIFFINLPVGLATLYFLKRADTTMRRAVPFDVWGQVTAVAAMGALTYGAIEIGVQGITSPSVLVSLVISFVALAGFVLLQQRGVHPMVPPSLLAPRNAKIAMVVGFTYTVGYFGLPFVMSLYLQQQRGLTAAETGVAFLPMMITGFMLTPFSSRLMHRFSHRALIVTGLFSMSVGLTCISLLPLAVPVWWIAIVMVLVGLAGPLVSPPITAVLLSSVPGHFAGTASGVFNTCRQVGGALAVAIFGALLARSPSFAAGFHSSLVLAAVMALATAMMSLRLQPSHP